MNLNLTGHHVEITAARRDYVTSVEKLKQKAEANVHVRGKDIFVETDSPDMYASIDSLVDKLDRQILKHKEKSADRRSDAAPISDEES